MIKRNVGFKLLFSSLLLLGLTGCFWKGSIRDSQDLTPTLELEAADLQAAKAGSAIATNRSTIKINALFNRDASLFTAESVQVQNGSLVAFTAVDATRFSLTLQAAGYGMVRVHLPPGAAMDKNGQQSIASDWLEIFYDDRPPVIDHLSIEPTAASQNASPTVSGTTELNAVLVLYQDANCSGAILGQGKTSGSGGFHVHSIPISTDGVYHMSVLALDAAGNTYCTPTTVDYVLDRTPPSTPAISLVYGSVQETPVPVNLASCADANETPRNIYQILYVVDSAAPPSLTDPGWTSCGAGNTDISFSGDGPHNVRLWARDSVGNLVASNTLTVTVDTVTPTWTSIVATESLLRNTLLDVIESDIQASEEGAGLYSLLTPATSPKCSDYGAVSIDPATGELQFTPVTNYYNVYNSANYNGGPCHVLVQFADQVTPAPHTVTQDVLVSVDWDNGTNNLPDITTWPGNDGTAIENCGGKCYANAAFDLDFVADAGGGSFEDPQNLTCSATTTDSYYVDISSCSLSGDNGVLSLLMGAAHPTASDTTTITLTVSDGVNTVSKTFTVHVDNYVLSMYPALVASNPLSCLMCHANVQADFVTDFGVAAASYGNASGILGFQPLDGSSVYHSNNDSVPFTINGRFYMPNITVTDPNFLKQVTGNPFSAGINLANFIANAWTYHVPYKDPSTGAIAADTDGYIKLAGTTLAKSGVFDSSRVTGGIQTLSSVTIRAPADTEIIGLSHAALDISTTGFIYQGPNSKPALSGLEVYTYGAYGDGDHKFVRNSGTIVCYGSVIISGPLYLKNPDIQTDDVGCSIYVAGNVFIETDRANAITYPGSTANATLQITSSRNVYMGVGLDDIADNRGNSNGSLNHAKRIVNAANPSGLRDAAGVNMSIKSNGDAGAFSYMSCPLNPTLAAYLDEHYVSNGNYTACIASENNCAYAGMAFNGWTGAVSAYNHLATDQLIYNGATLINRVQAYESMCRYNGGWQMTGYGSYGWGWSGSWGEVPTTVGAATINTLRVSTNFTHFRVNGQAVHSRYFGTFNGSVISPYALFAIGNLTFTYDTNLNSVVPYPKLMSPNPIFDTSF